MVDFKLDYQSAREAQLLLMRIFFFFFSVSKQNATGLAKKGGLLHSSKELFFTCYLSYIRSDSLPSRSAMLITHQFSSAEPFLRQTKYLIELQPDTFV